MCWYIEAVTGYASSFLCPMRSGREDRMGEREQKDEGHRT